VRKRVAPAKVKRISTGPSKPKVVAKVRRSGEQAYGDRFTWAELCAKVKARDGFKCRLCSRTEFLQVDHIRQVARGGQSVMHNLWTLCDFCHAKRPGHKQAKHLIMAKRNATT